MSDADEGELDTMGLLREACGGPAAVEKKHRRDALLESVSAGHVWAAA